MSSDNSSNNSNNNQNKPPSPPPTDMQRNRRGSITMPLVNIFQRSNSIAGTPVYPSTIANAANQRRLSLTTQVGLSGTSPTSATLGRRASMSTNSSDYDENVIEEEDIVAASRTAPVTPFTTRRVSFGTGAGMRRPAGNSPGTSNGRSNARFSAYLASPLEERPCPPWHCRPCSCVCDVLEASIFQHDSDAAHAKKYHSTPFLS